MDPDPDPHHGDKSNPDLHPDARIRIRIIVMRIHNTGCDLG
jgi:hypothetical protein